MRPRCSSPLSSQIGPHGASPPTRIDRKCSAPTISAASQSTTGRLSARITTGSRSSERRTSPDEQHLRLHDHDGTGISALRFNKPDGDVKVSVRGEPKIVDGIYVCAHKHEKGQAGRCTPGDANCNNYCNMAPEKGPMQDHPLPCVQVFEGPYAETVVPAAEWNRMMQSAR